MSMDSASARIMWPDKTNILTCTDFGDIGQCCGPTLGLDENPGGWCHNSPNNLITVYPESCYSVKHREGKMPDIGFGLHAEVCCGRYEAVKQLPRSFWVKLLCQRDGWSDAHIAQILATPPELYYRVRGEISDYYYGLRNPSSVRQMVLSQPSVGRSSSRKSNLRGTGISVSKCPSCGSKWNTDVCDNCGHGGGI